MCLKGAESRRNCMRTLFVRRVNEIGIKSLGIGIGIGIGVGGYVYGEGWRVRYGYKH